MSRIDLLRESRNNTWEQAKRLLDRAKEEKRNLYGEEERQYEQLTADLDAISGQIRRLEDSERTDRQTEESMRKLGLVTHTRAQSSEVGDEIRHTILTKSNAPLEFRAPDDEMRSYFAPGIERRALTTSTGSAGMRGISFYDRVLTHMVDESAILAAGATVIQSNSGEPLRIPKSTAFSTAAIVTEGAQIGTSEPTLDTFTLNAYKYAFMVYITRELAEDANFDLEGWLARESGNALGRAFGAHAITGTGTGQPTGALTGATLGNTGPTGTATSFGTHTTAGQGGDLLHDLYASLAAPYARSESAAWLMRNATLASIRKLRDADGRYVFSADIPAGSGAAGTILGRPVYTDPNMPAIGANAKSVLFGDFSKYYVRRINGIRFERSDEFKFDTDQVAFRCVARLDGALGDTTGALKYFAHSAT